MVDSQKLTLFCKKALIKAGVNSKIASNIASSLVLTSLRGVDSHGIRLLPHYINAVRIGRINPNPKYRFRFKKQTAGLMDAKDGFGIDAGIAAMRKAMSLARKSGVAAIGVYNSSHFGAAAIYGLEAAKNGLIGLAFTSTDSLVIPTNGRRPYLGTNPICFCAPIQNEGPFCLDMATSVVPLNKIMNYKSKGQNLEPGWAVDARGKPTINASDAAWLLPFGGYKGFGLEVMVEILSSILTGMNFGRHIVKMYPLTGRKRQLGHFFVAININSFIPLAKFKKNLKAMCDELRNEPAFVKSRRVVVPGDPEKKYFVIRSREGIPMAQPLVAEFRQLAEELGLKTGF